MILEALGASLISLRGTFLTKKKKKIVDFSLLPQQMVSEFFQKKYNMYFLKRYETPVSLTIAGYTTGYKFLQLKEMKSSD